MLPHLKIQPESALFQSGYGRALICPLGECMIAQTVQI